jgi:hypothetical protein
MNALGVTETKIAVLDLLIDMSKKFGGIITKDDLMIMREALIKNAKESELDEVFNELEKENGF